MLKETKIIIKFTLYFQAPPSLCIIKIDIGIIAGFYGKNLKLKTSWSSIDFN